MTTTKQSWLRRGLSAFLATVMVLSMNIVSAFAQDGSASQAGFADGVYRVQANLYQALRDDRLSMGNGSIRGSDTYNDKHAADDTDYRPLLIVEDGKATVIMEFVPMGFIGMHGYLLNVGMLSDITYNQYGYPTEYTETPATILSEHRMTDGSVAYDSYNDPDSSSVLEEANGKAYPHVIAMPIELPETPVTQKATDSPFIHVFVPVMGSLGSGDQVANLQLDYDNMTEVTDLSGEVEYWLWRAMQAEKGNASEENWTALQEVIADTKTKLSNTLTGVTLEGDLMSPAVVRELDEMDTSERAAQVQKLQNAINALIVDSSSLEQALAEAAGVDGSLYTTTSYNALQKAVQKGQALLDGGSYTEQQIADAAQAVLDALNALKPVTSEDGWDGVTTREPQAIGESLWGVSSAEELAWIAQHVNNGGESKDIALQADIDLNGRAWTPIGTEDHPFTGSVGGNGCTITGLRVNTDAKYAGLFGYITGDEDEKSAVDYLTVEGSVTSSANDTGGLVGYAENYRFTGCTTNVNIRNTSSGFTAGYVGGFVGDLRSCTLTHCSNHGDVSAQRASRVAGLAGNAFNSYVIDCMNDGTILGGSNTGGLVGFYCVNTGMAGILDSYNAGNVTGHGGNVGGITGSVTVPNAMATLSSLYNRGDIAGQTAVGGIVGGFNGGELSQILAVYSTGKVSGTTVYLSNAGALVGRLYSGSLSTAYALEGTFEQLYTSADGLIIRSTEFHDKTWFQSEDFMTAMAYHSDDFAFVEELNGGYPVLAFQVEEIELEEYRAQALQEIQSYKDPADYAGLSQTAVKNTISNAVELMEKANTREQIESCLSDAKARLNEIPNDVNYGLNLTQLNKKLTEAKAIQAQGGELYTQESWNSLTATISGVEHLLEAGFETQEKVDTYVGHLTDNIDSLTYKPADYTAVDNALAKVPDDLSGYTDETVAAVNAALKAVVRDKNITEQKAVNAMAEAIEDALADLKEKEPDTPDELDRFNLEDGVYSVYGEMIKLNRTDKSMANDAINHTIKLTVEDGIYYLNMDFHGLAYLNRFGYLAELSYYDNGYTYGQYGAVEGTLLPATVLSTQKNADGTDVMDEFNQAGGSYAGKLYPDQIRFPLVTGALADEDGYVPLHVFVPVMEAISAGTGNQDVLLKLDWSTLKETSEDDPAFEPGEPVEPSPAVDYTDAKTGVKVHADKGVLDEDVQIVVTEITQCEDYKTAISTLSDVGKKFKLYEIHFEDAEGNVVQPNGMVTVSYPIPKGYAEDKLALYRINGDGTKTLVKGTADNGFYQVVSRSFSTYALVETGSTITDAENTANIPQTGDSSNAAVFVLLALAAVGMISVPLVTRRRKSEEA